MDIGIVGGGASGMILASKLKNVNITLLERNSKLGKKLLLTGNGKCNFTNTDFKDILNIYNSDFAISVYKKYDNSSFIKYFNELGIVAKCENHRGIDYVYPNSNKSTSVVYNLLDKIASNDVNIIYNSFVTSVIKEGSKFKVKTNDDKVYCFDKVVLACGGNSYQNTGSDGNAYNIAKSFGHKIIEPNPALCPLKYNNEDLKKIKGVRIEAKLYSSQNNFNEVGEIQFTDFGISGVPIFNLSRLISKEVNNCKAVEVFLDFYTMDNSNQDLHFKSLLEYLHDRKKNLIYKRIKDFLCGFLPDEISEVVLNRSNLKSKSVDELTDGELNNIAENIINFKVVIVGSASFDNAQITVGGIDTNYVNQETLESKLVKDLYFTGEILDIDGRCGGYNLQLAYSTASIVADSIRG